MKVYATSVTTTRIITSKSSSIEMASRFNGDVPCIGFRLRKRSALIPASKLAADKTASCIQEEHTKNESYQLESGFQTPCTSQPLSIPLVLWLPSFGQDEANGQIPTTKEIRKRKNLEFSGVRVNLNQRFDAVADTAQNEIDLGDFASQISF